MKRAIGIFLFITVLFLFPANSSAQFSDFLKKLKDSIFSGEENSVLTEDTIIKGLKEALKIGTEKTVEHLSKQGSYLNNPEIKIKLPEPLKKIENIVRKTGLGFYIDSLEQSMNGAAEMAAPMAKDIVLDALKEMSFSDAKKILKGKENEATLYFREKSYNRLMDIFKPAVRSSMSKTGAIKKYQDIESKLKSIPFIESLPVNYDLDGYVAGAALDGIFHMIEKEEKQIRENPEARITELLREVFGSK